jgi:hypothetical protein
VTVAHDISVQIDGAGAASAFFNSATIRANSGTAALAITNGASLTPGNFGGATTGGMHWHRRFNDDAANRRLRALMIEEFGSTPDLAKRTPR